MDYLEITEDDIVKINFNGERLEGDKKPSSEWMMHAEIYKNYPAYNAIVHTHSSFATAFAVSRKKIPLILIEMEPFLGGEIEVAPFEPSGSLELARSILPYLKRTNSCLLIFYLKVFFHILLKFFCNSCRTSDIIYHILPAIDNCLSCVRLKINGEILC